jgi:hypothetical protein
MTELSPSLPFAKAGDKLGLSRKFNYGSHFIWRGNQEEQELQV